MMETLILVAVLAVLIYYYTIKPMYYWSERNVKQPTNYWLIGNTYSFILGLKSVAAFYQETCQAFSDTRYVGLHFITKPVLLVKDIDLIKQITIKDFDYFTDHSKFLPDNDPLWSNNLIFLTGQKWKDVRPVVSSNFSSSKMKLMFVLMSETAVNFTSILKSQAEGVIEFEAKTLVSRFATDLIATTAFGFKTDSLKEPNNEFYLKICAASDVTNLKSFINAIAYNLFPKLYKLIDIQFFSKDVRKFFYDIVEKNVKYRQRNGIVRPDFIDLLLKARKQKSNDDQSVVDTHFSTVQANKIGVDKPVTKNKPNNSDILSNAFIFIIGGLHSTSSVISFMCYELALHSDIQNKLRMEIQSKFETCNGNIKYEDLMSLKYLDMVVLESLRKWMNFPATDRVCTKKYTIPAVNPEESPLTLEPGMSIWIPIYAIHNDSKYYPNPERFDPERFSDENKDKIKPYTYFPFGIGPRSCLGSRFAILQAKTIMFYLLLNLEIVVTSKTKIPAVRAPFDLIGTSALGGLGLKKNENKYI